jgi:DNA-binding transcriptional LysR family regulator
MQWQQIIGFYNVARLGSFTRAAEATFRTQSALTQQIRALENELDCRLFERIGKRKLILTPAGEKLLVFAESLLRKYEQVIQEIHEDGGLQKGRLRIAAPFTTLYHLMPDVIKRYIKRFPAIELSLFDRSQRHVIELVKRGDVDFGITLESAVPGELGKVRWKKVESVLLVPRGHPLAESKTGSRKVSAKQIARYPLILPPKTVAFSHRSTLEELFRKYNVDYHIIMESSNVELSSVYVEMGLGISFATIARDLPAFKKRKVEFISLNHYFKPEYITVIMRRDKALAQFQRAFLETLTGSPPVP